MNEYDSSKMADLLDATHGYQLTEVAEEADVLLLNTCSIREKAQEKVFHQLGRWKLLKEEPRPDYWRRRLCRLSGRPPYSPTRPLRRYYFRAADAASSAGDDQLRSRQPQSGSGRQFPEIEKFDRLPEPRAEGPTAFVSIMEGCNKYCTYCVVPYTRGEEVSRPCDDILFEIAQLAAQGSVKSTCWVKTSMPGAARTTTERPAVLPICCVWSRRSTVSTAFALPPATRSSLPMTSLMSIAIRRSW